MTISIAGSATTAGVTFSFGVALERLTTPAVNAVMRQALRPRLSHAGGLLTIDGVPVGPIFGGTAPYNTELDFRTLLLDILGFSSDEYLSIGYHSLDTPFRSTVCSPDLALRTLDQIPGDADIYFGVSPVQGPARESSGRGVAKDVTRLSALIADLDVKPGGCPDLDVAHAIIDELSVILDSRPAAITLSGGGLHPYWPIRDGYRVSNADLEAILKQWGDLVRTTAAKHGVKKIDSVFDLSRMLRVPGSYNRKRMSDAGVPQLVVCRRDQGVPLTLNEITTILEPYHRTAHGRDPHPVRNRHSSADWPLSTVTCKYVSVMIEAWSNPDEIPSGAARHPWFLSQMVRLWCARRLGCITREDFERAGEVAEQTFTRLCATRVPIRTIPSREITDIHAAAISRASAKSPREVHEELGNHQHLWAPPDNPSYCAQQVVARCQSPLRYWSGTWFEWCATHYRIITVERIRDILYGLLTDAQYLNSAAEPRSWKPNPKKLNDVIDATRRLVELPSTMTAPNWINRDSEHVIPCANGLVRVMERDLQAHTPNFFNTFALPFDYNSDAPRPQRWLKFMDEVFPGDPDSVETLQEWFGYVISGRTDLQKMLLVIGPPRTGKGTIARTLIALIGDQAHCAVTESSLASDFGLAPLVDKTLAVFSDARVTVRNKKIVETLLSITGQDTVPVNRKYRDAVSTRLGTRFMIMSNEPPEFPDNSGAIVSRIIALSTPNSWIGREDITLDAAIRDELPGILNWALDGMTRLNQRGAFTQPTTGQEILHLLSDMGSPITQFIQTRCLLGPHETHTALKQHVFAAWTRWCDQNGHPPGNQSRFAASLYAAYPTRIKQTRRGSGGDRQQHFSGIKLQ